MIKEQNKKGQGKINDYPFNVPFYDRIAYEDKIKDNCAWIKECCKYLDDYHGDSHLVEKYDRYKRNYAIANGRGDEEIKAYASEFNSQYNTLSTDVVDINNLMTKNWDILSPIYKSSVGQQQKTKLNCFVKDSSGYNLNYKKRKHQEFYRDYLQKNMFAKINEEATREIMMKHGIEDIKSLSPEEQKEVKFEIEESKQFKSLKDVDDFMKNKYRSPFETQLQNLVDWYISEHDIKFKTDEAFKHLYLTGMEVAKQGIDNNCMPYLKICNPKGFRYKGKPNSFFIEEGEWWIYEEEDTYTNVIRDIGHDEEAIKQLADTLMGSDSSFKAYTKGEVPNDINRLVATINMHTDGAFLENAPDPATPAGQNFIRSLYNSIGHNRNGMDYIKKTHFCFTAMDKAYKVWRVDKESDQLEFFWVGENYKTNEEKDYRVEEHWTRSYYEAESYGENADVFVNMRRVKYQNRDMNNPSNLVPVYTGVEYSKLFDNAPAVAPIEFGFPYQYDYNILKNTLERIDRTSIGSVLALPQSVIPQDWNIAKYSRTMQESRIAYIPDQEIDNIQAIQSLFRTLQFDTFSESKYYLERLQYTKKEAEVAMNYSPSSLGLAAPSMTATNNQQNIIQGSYKTEDISSLHNKWLSNLLSNGLNVLKVALYENKTLRDYLLSDLGLAIMNTDFNLLMDAIPFVEIINDSEKVQEIKEYKSLLQPMIQNQMVTMSEATKIHFNRNPVEMINIAEKAERNLEETMQANKQAEQKRWEEEMALKKQIADDALAQAEKHFQEELAHKYYESDKDSVKYQLAQDVDNNKIPDPVQVAMIKAKIDEDKLKSQERQHEKELKNKLDLKKLERSVK